NPPSFSTKRISVLMAGPDSYRDEPVLYLLITEATISGYFFIFSMYFLLFIDLMCASTSRACL
ncbi:hypothetical protein O4H26_15450, partial [Aequorivita viscosa]|nr:hypothetical protein [Aequorivita viscosa]